MNAEQFVTSSRKEINEYFDALQDFAKQSDIQEILRKISAYSARASYMAAQSAKSNNPSVTQFLENELERFIKEVEFQFRIWSRYEAVTAREWEMTK